MILLTPAERLHCHLKGKLTVIWSPVCEPNMIGCSTVLHSCDRCRWYILTLWCFPLPSALCPLPSFREWELQSTLLIASPNFSHLSIVSVNHSCRHRYLCSFMNALMPWLTSVIVYPRLCHWLCIPSLYFAGFVPGPASLSESLPSIASAVIQSFFTLRCASPIMWLALHCGKWWYVQRNILRHGKVWKNTVPHKEW